ncbi:MAG: STAS domain-containing protein [Acidimicrobiia bacterium]
MIGPSFKVETTERGHAVHVVVSGEIDIKTAPELEAAITDRASDHLVIDVNDVDFIDSTGLRVLVVAKTRTGENGGSLVIVAPDGSAVLRTIRLAGMAADFHVVAHPDEVTAPE